MKVMTFNLRFENENDGENSWQYRRDLVIGIVRKYKPSILGTQEGMPQQLQYLQEQLTEYAVCDTGRVWDKTCQYPTLFYRWEEFESRGGGEFWLSTTPEVHRSKDWDSAFPRMMSYIQLECLKTGKSFWSVVTHLDHIGSEARMQQAGIIFKWICELDAPVILMGDFNVGPGSGVHALLTSPGCGLQDTWKELGRQDNFESMTHHGFLGTPQKDRIDWILSSSHFHVLSAHIIRDHMENRYPSDHFPYMVELDYT